MNGVQHEDFEHSQLWQTLAQQEQLTDAQVAQFKQYLSLLLEWNKRINLTTITNEKDILDYHFQDSLRIGDFVDISSLHMVADVGTGGGFPGIPLKIKYPHLHVVLIEVNQKKIIFLREVINQLSLDNVEICDLDWRTFLRKTSYPVDMFVARASLKPSELLHMFKPASPYKDKQVVYWASKKWQPNKFELPYVQKDFSYEVGGKKRRLIVFARSS